MIYTLPKVDKYGVLAKHTTPQNRLGEYFCDNETNQLWVYLRANEAISKGAAVASRARQTIASGLQTADAGSQKLVFSGVNLNTLFPRVPNQPRFAEYMVVHEVGGDQIGVVWEHTQTEMSVEWTSELDLDLTTSLASSADVLFATPWLVDESPTASVVIGIAQRDIAVGEYFWALVEGFGWALAGAAVAVNAPLRIPTAGDGEGDDPTTGAVAPYAYTLAAGVEDKLVPVIAAAPLQIGIPPFQGGRSQISYQHPTV